ncbi:MAG: arsenate reductase ArsC [Thermoguttaceae bacterium]|jgi:arsenate reductase|nr:arsenate reductase ArsC [Thermoguttaceae bacterium]
MDKKRVLFVCIHNSARSQMAEAWTNHLFGESLEAESAGLEPGQLNPLVVRSMADAGIDISQKQTQSVSDVLNAGKAYAYVITVCDETAAERCPVFPGTTTRLHWGFPDPAALTGTDDEKLVRIGDIRDAIRAKIESWAPELMNR